MGGYGSGRHGFASPKQTVEGCLVLSAAKMQSGGSIEAGLYRGGSLVWRRVSTGEQTAAIGYIVNTLSSEPPTIRLQYTSKRPGEDQRESLDYPVGLTATPLPWGGSRFPNGNESRIAAPVRWWFLCPLTGCGRRVGKLYLPPGGRYFGCRHCYDLTYESCQESHKFDGMYRMLAAQAGIPPANVKRLLNRERGL